MNLCTLLVFLFFSFFKVWKCLKNTVHHNRWHLQCQYQYKTCNTLSRTPDVFSPRTPVLSTALTGRWLHHGWWGQELELLCGWNVHRRWPRSLRIFHGAWLCWPRALSDLCHLNLLAVLITDNLRERDHLGDPGVNRRIILSWVFRTWDVGVGTGSIWLRIWTGGGNLWVR